MRRPYFIVAPPYTERSAGVKALHLLCSSLSAEGETASVVPMGVWDPVDENAVVVYPEIVEGNPLNAKNVVRWLLYYAGRYRGNKKFPAADTVVGYTTRVARAYGTENVLFLPTVDDAVFVAPPEGTVRKGSCFYAHKYRMFGGAPADIRGSVEITNPGQSREEILRLLQTSEVFYAYEDTALIIEAVLCGCPVICIPSGFFTEAFGLEDYRPGVAWGVSEFDRARATIGEAHKRYQLLKDVFQVQLEKFIKVTQNG